MTGLVFGEQPRWHEDRLWFSDWGSQEVIAVDLEGNSEVILRGPSFPLCVDWLPDGRLLLTSARDGLLLRRGPGGSLAGPAPLTRLSYGRLEGMVGEGGGDGYGQRRGALPFVREEVAPPVV